MLQFDEYLGCFNKDLWFALLKKYFLSEISTTIKKIHIPIFESINIQNNVILEQSCKVLEQKVLKSL